MLFDDPIPQKDGTLLKGMITNSKLYISSFKKDSDIVYARLSIYGQIDRFIWQNDIELYTLRENNWYDDKKEVYCVSVRLTWEEKERN